jgi:hypothetical protein
MTTKLVIRGNIYKHVHIIDGITLTYVSVPLSKKEINSNQSIRESNTY